MTDTDRTAERAAEKCTCYWTDPSTWTTHYGAVEPGSQREWNPECPEHGMASEIRARLAAASPGPWTTGSRDESGNLYVGQADPEGALVATAGEGDADLIAHAPTDLAYLLERVGELEDQLAKARAAAAIDALTTARRAVSDHRIGLGRNRSRVDARFQGRLQGLDEAAGRLTALIKSLRANEPGIEAGDEH